MILLRMILVSHLNSFISLILTIILCLQPGTCFNILLMPYAFKSHVFEITAIGAGLAERGNKMFILLPTSYPSLDQLDSKFELITYAVKKPDFYSKDDSGWEKIAMTVTPIQELRLSIDGFIELCTNPLEDEALPEKLFKLRLDMAIVDGFPGSRCLYLIANKLGVPYVTLTTQYEPWVWRNPALPSFIPFPLAAIYTERMTFNERIQNTITLIDWTAWPAVPYMEDSFLKPYLPEGSDLTFSKLAARSLLWLIDSDVAIDYARPTMANEIYVGGLTTRPAKPLADDLEKFASETIEGFVVVSFGSSGILDDADSYEMLVNAFARLEQLVIWKYSKDLPSNSKVPSNVRILKWLPQNDLLGHPNCRLFVTHCGANGQFEALYHGVPMLGIPVFADQPYNARRMEYKGYGRFLQLHSLTSDSLFDAISEILTNNIYLENIRHGSAIFRSHQQTPKERAVWWVEHVLNHGGKHLHSIALDMPWYEYLMLDILLVLVILPVVIVVSFVSFCCACILLRIRYSKTKVKLN